MDLHPAKHFVQRLLGIQSPSKVAEKTFKAGWDAGYEPIKRTFEAQFNTNVTFSCTKEGEMTLMIDNPTPEVIKSVLNLMEELGSYE